MLVQRVVIGLILVCWGSLPAAASEGERSEGEQSWAANLTLRDGSRREGRFQPSGERGHFLWSEASRNLSGDGEASANGDSSGGWQTEQISWTDVSSIQFGPPRNRPSQLSPLQQHRGQAEARRKAALRGAWRPEQDHAEIDGGDETVVAAWEHAIHLRGGDVISGRLQAIDSSSVRFTTDRYGTVSLPWESVTRVELDDLSAWTPLEEASKRRLLTVPRARFDEPPTHVLISPRGDYLRGRLLGLSGQRIQFELALGQAEIPLEQVGQIIWLELPLEAGGSRKAGEEKRDQSDSIQIVRSDGERLTFESARFDGDAVRGTHPWLGECEVPLRDVARVLQGGAIETESSGRGLQGWTARLAELPLAGEESVAPSQNSPSRNSP